MSTADGKLEQHCRSYLLLIFFFSKGYFIVFFLPLPFLFFFHTLPSWGYVMAEPGADYFRRAAR